MTILTSELGGSGGGGGVPVGTVLPIRSSDDVYVAPDGSTWLKGGVFETTEGTYPDAAYATTGFTGDVFEGYNQPTGVAHDGTDFWTCSDASNKLYKYTSTGRVEYSSPDGNPQSLDFDGTDILVVGYGGDAVYKVNPSTGSVTSSFSVFSQTNAAYGVTWDGTFIWVLSIATAPAKVFKYNSSGTYQNVSYDLDITSVRDIAYDGADFWCVDESAKRITKLSSTFVPTGEFYSVPNPTRPFGIYYAAFDSSLWVADLVNSFDNVKQFALSTSYGIGSATDTDSSIPLYVKVA